MKNTATKISKTKVLRHEVTEAQGGHDPIQDTSRVWVECPVRYDPDEITAEDIVHDGAITVVPEPDRFAAIRRLPSSWPSKEMLLP